MYDKDFAELVKIAAEKLKEDTVYKMLTRSEDYQKESDERDKAERNYERLIVLFQTNLSLMILLREMIIIPIQDTLLLWIIALTM